MTLFCFTILIAVCLVLPRLLLPYMAFHPTREVRFTPRDVGLDYEEATILSGGYRLAAWHVPAPRARATLLFCHGNGGNLGHRVESIEIFHRLGLSVLIFDYRGYGDSEGRPTPAGTAEDARAAWEWLAREKGVTPGELLLFGRSLGGAVALELTRQVTPRAIIWEDGRSFRIDAVRDYRPASAMERGRSGDCYTVIIHGEEKHLFFERSSLLFGGRLGRWWVECGTAAPP